jgi:hypothetical protein
MTTATGRAVRATLLIPFLCIGALLNSCGAADSDSLPTPGPVSVASAVYVWFTTVQRHFAGLEQAMTAAANSSCGSVSGSGAAAAIVAAAKTLQGDPVFPIPDGNQVWQGALRDLTIAGKACEAEVQDPTNPTLAEDAQSSLIGGNLELEEVVNLINNDFRAAGYPTLAP